MDWQLETLNTIRKLEMDSYIYHLTYDQDGLKNLWEVNDFSRDGDGTTGSHKEKIWQCLLTRYHKQQSISI